ncbi:hypothetical protein SAVERM_3271 [Streptomyces avermitilis MA-4680 = NBRC 14893]|uniref:Uncharacterized protein n=2 Tax=Streptomyces TaxID=1883 RepID=Q82I87_STRAW|nr:hypothetical protein SAVERM_3271 [Streptomyces avermitilis MA-4680 = NBRC 14893]
MPTGSPPMTLGGHMGPIEHPRRIVPGGTPAAPGTQAGTGRRLIAAANETRQRTASTPGARTIRRELYQPRSRRLLDAVAQLDAGLDEAACRQLADRIRDEYTTTYDDVPLGFVARCYLGPPYVDHQLNLFQVIVKHFAPSQRMPDPFDGARMLARSGAYAYIEVYAGGLILPVLEDGTVVRP